MDAYVSSPRPSLLCLEKSLLLEIFSLSIFIGNCSRSDCSTASSCSEIGSQRPEPTKFPVKFPVSRVFSWRRVRSALRRQPTSPRVGEISVRDTRNARPRRAFAILGAVSRFPISQNARPIRRKSPATTVNIPVFGRRRPEIECDQHCLARERVWSRLAHL
jgi:hypothetical protein